MAHKRNFRATRKEKPAKPFTGMMNQLKKESLVLVNLGKFEGFRKALIDADIDYELGDFHNGGIFVVKKED